MTTTATELRAQLAKIDDEVATLQSKLQLLSEKRQTIFRRLDAVIYPVLTLPSEITAEIFMHYLGNFPVITHERALKTYPPLLLASVCREWRRVALSFPRLWATLRLKWDLETVNCREHLLERWLLRAGSCPLDLDLSGSDLTKSKSISSAIVQYAPQLRKLTLTPPQSASHFSSATAPAQPCFPVLQTLTVDFTGRFDETITTFGDAPRLREVCISGGSRFRIDLPWNQLTRLDLNNSNVASSLKVLEQTPNLEALSFYTHTKFDDDQTHVVMKKLHTLRFDPCSAWELLYFLTAPALKTLELAFPTESDDDLDALCSFISRSSCTVQALHLHDHTAKELMDCLQLFESLEQLTIQFGGVWNARLSDYDKDDHFELEDQYCLLVLGFLKERRQLPALKSLSLVDFPMAIDAALLTSMLNSRRQSCGVANLESFKLVFKHQARQGYEELHISELRTLVDDGLNIHIEWPADQTSKNVNPEMVARINAAS
ncbi:hypothetical protein C8J57DRAFT_1191488 [Mycena rebaudengoi]|nr:hypothetical protein C8J57DRAFT_1191488 [Mycena rebaudengoi]